MKNTPSFTGVPLNFAKSFGTLLLNLCLRISYTASLSDAQNYRFLALKKKLGRGSSLPKGKKIKKERKKKSCMWPVSQAASPVCEPITSSL